jgi:uncharacterized protein YneF (UPF0154 family)
MSNLLIFGLIVFVLGAGVVLGGYLLIRAMVRDIEREP